MSDTSRFDKYIPIFGKADDKRVRLFLNEWEDMVKVYFNHTRYDYPEVVVNSSYEAYKAHPDYGVPPSATPEQDQSLKTTRAAMKNDAFANKYTVPDKDFISPEWLQFYVSVAYRLQCRKIQNNNYNSEMFNAIVNLANDNSYISSLIVSLLSKFAYFYDSKNTYDFHNDWRQLNQNVTIVFFDFSSIMTGLLSRAHEDYQIYPIIPTIQSKHITYQIISKYYDEIVDKIGFAAMGINIGVTSDEVFVSYLSFYYALQAYKNGDNLTNIKAASAGAVAMALVSGPYNGEAVRRNGLLLDGRGLITIGNLMNGVIRVLPGSTTPLEALKAGYDAFFNVPLSRSKLADPREIYFDLLINEKTPDNIYNLLNLISDNTNLAKFKTVPEFNDIINKYQSDRYYISPYLFYGLLGLDSNNDALDKVLECIQPTVPNLYDCNNGPLAVPGGAAPTLGQRIDNLRNEMKKSYLYEYSKFKKLVDGFTDSTIVKKLDIYTFYASFIKIIYDNFNDKKEFTYKLDKYLLSLLLEEAKSKAQDDEGDEFFNLPDEQEQIENIYYRKNNRIYKKNPNGNDYDIDINSVKFNQLYQLDNNCYTTGAQKQVLDDNNHTLTCADYIRDCLFGKNIDQCKLYLQSNKFWDNAAKEVDEMLPKVALDTLDALQFQKKQVVNENLNREFYQYISVNEWLNYLHKISEMPNSTISDYDITQITNNIQLMEYLKLLVIKINRNPTLLNEDYTGADIPDDPNSPFKGTLLHDRLGIPPLLDSYSSASSFNYVKQNIIRCNQGIQRILGIFPGVPVGAVGPLNMVSVMRGGLNQPYSSELIEEFEDRLKNEYKRTSHIFKTTFMGFEQRLKHYNKKISNNNASKINNLIFSLQQTEKKLLQIFLIIERYLKFLDAGGSSLDKKSEVNMKTMSDFVNRGRNDHNKIMTKQQYLLSIFESMVHAIENKNY